jgi:molybdopterin converting factor subunit 1
MTAPNHTTRIAAIVPAAGASRRMGRPKLLIELDGRPLIARVVSALAAGGARPVVVVAPPADVPEGPPIADAAARAGAVVVVPEARPAEMRDSVELGLAELERAEGSQPLAVVLAPADSPGLDGPLVARLAKRWRERPEAIVIPTSGGRRGHPIVLPRGLAQSIVHLPPDAGVNALVARHEEDVVEVDVADEAVIDDLDTPDDLRRFEARRGVQERVVRLFAIARERAGRGEVAIRLPAKATVADLRAALAEQVPGLAAIAPRVMIAVDSEYADDDYELTPGASLAVIPPVSGG